MKHEVVEGRQVMERELAAIKSSISALASSFSVVTGGVSELIQLGQATMGASAMVNESLVASGIVVKKEKLSQVDIPGVLLQINAKLHGLELSSSSLLDTSGKGANKPPPLALTPAAATKPTSSSPTPARAIGPKNSRWGLAPGPASGQVQTPAPLVKPKPGSVSRNIARQFNSNQGFSPASNPALFKDMLKAEETIMTQAQLEQKLAQYGAAGQKRPRPE